MGDISKTAVDGADGALLENEVTDLIIGAAIEVHKHLGPGLLESAYEACLCYELEQAGVSFERQVNLPDAYKGLRLDCSYRMDLVVEDCVVVEIKAIDQLLPIHTAQLLTYLRSYGEQVGLLINFNETVLTKGLKRIVNHYTGPALGPRISPPSPSDALRFSPRTTPRRRDSAVNSSYKDPR